MERTILTLNELKQALFIGEELVLKLKGEYPQLKVKVVASLGYGIASSEMTNLEIFKKAGSIFVKSEQRVECSVLLSLIDKIEAQRDYHRNKVDIVNQIRANSELRISSLVSVMAIDENVKVELQLDEPDVDLINWLNTRIKIYQGYDAKNPFSFSRVHIGRARDLLK